MTTITTLRLAHVVSGLALAAGLFAADPAPKKAPPPPPLPGAGTGGTLAGVARYLKARKPSVQVYLADPPGSALCECWPRHAGLAMRTGVPRLATYAPRLPASLTHAS